MRPPALNPWKFMFKFKNQKVDHRAPRRSATGAPRPTLKRPPRVFPHLNLNLNLLVLLLLPASLPAAVTYQETIRPLFQESCLNCHNPDKHKAGLDLSTYDATMDGSDNGKVVESGDAEKSLLYQVLAHTQEPYMPKGGDKLPDSQLEIIRQWIASNAPEKAGGLIAKTNAGPAVAVVPVEEKPKGPVAMPTNGLLEPFVHTIRRGAVPSVAGSPWAPLVALAAQKQVLLYNTDSLQLIGVLPFPEGFPAIVRFSHNGSLLIAGGGVGAKLGHVVIWDIVTGRRIAEVGDEFDTVIAADISPDQSLIALGGPSRLVKIFSAADGKMICKMKKHTDWVTAVCFTPDGKSLISGDRAGGLAVWDCQGHELQSVSAHAAAITGIACQGSFVATSSEDGTVKFWDIVEGKEIKSWHAHDGGVRSVAFTADGHILTSGRDRLVRLWDINGNAVKQFDPLNDIAMQAAFAGGKIIAADWSGVVRVWTPDGTRAGELDSNPPTIAQRIDALNKRLADLDAIAVKRRDARTRAEAALGAARNQAAEAHAELDAKKTALAAGQNELGVLQKQCAEAPAAIQKARQVFARLSLVSSEIACASTLDPLLDPAATSALTSRALAGQALAAQNARLAQSQAALASMRNQCATLTGDIRARAASNAALAAAVKSTADSLAAATAAQDKTAAQINAARLGLAKWQAAAARLTANPEYAFRKTDAK
jgi:WD40 repeat protein